MSIIIRQASAQDAASIQRVWTAAFSNDTHTLFKAHEKGKDLSKELPLDLIPSWMDIDPKKGTFLVAEDTKGKLLGWSAWNYYNLDGSKQDDGAAETPLDAPVQYDDLTGLSSLDKLRTITSGHLFAMYDRLCVPFHRVIYAQAIAVDPTAQSQGVGTAMIRHIVNLANEHGALVWVHLSDSPAGARAFEKNGFKERASNKVDLDDYRVKPYPSGREKWGTYRFRLLVRDAA